MIDFVNKYLGANLNLNKPSTYVKIFVLFAFLSFVAHASMKMLAYIL